MSDDATGHDGTDATRRDATGGDLVVSVADAAELLGISTGAVRKRLERGQLAGRKVGGQWQVILTGVDATGHVTTTAAGATGHDATNETGATRRDATTPAVPGAARAQLEAIRDEWLRPLIERNEALAERAGRLEAERDQAARERDALRDEVERLRAAAAPAPLPEEEDDEPRPAGEAPMPRWRRWLRRLAEGP